MNTNKLLDGNYAKQCDSAPAFTGETKHFNGVQANMESFGFVKQSPIESSLKAFNRHEYTT